MKLLYKMRIGVVPLFVVGAFVLGTMAVAGPIVVNCDEWTFADSGGFHYDPASTAQYADNCAAFLTGGFGNKILIYSANYGLDGTQLRQTLQNAGYNVTEDQSFSTPLAQFTPSYFNAIFLCGPATPTLNNSDLLSALTNFSAHCGGVYIGAGSGAGIFSGDAASEAGYWNPFLQPNGLSLASSYNSVNGSVPVNGTGTTLANAILTGVTELYFALGNDVSVYNGNANAQVISSTLPNGGGDGLIGVTTPCPTIAIAQTGNGGASFTITGSYLPHTYTLLSTTDLNLIEWRILGTNLLPYIVNPTNHIEFFKIK